MRGLKIRFGVAMVFIGTFMASSVVAEVQDSGVQLEISCWSGGHLVFYDIASIKDVSIEHSALVGKTTNGDEFIAFGDCVAVPVGYGE